MVDYFRSDQIQDGGRSPFRKALTGHISATAHPVEFMFGSIEFSWAWDRLTSGQLMWKMAAVVIGMVLRKYPSTAVPDDTVY